MPGQRAPSPVPFWAATGLPESGVVVSSSLDGICRLSVRLYGKRTSSATPGASQPAPGGLGCVATCVGSDRLGSSVQESSAFLERGWGLHGGSCPFEQSRLAACVKEVRPGLAPLPKCPKLSRPPSAGTGHRPALLAVLLRIRPWASLDRRRAICLKGEPTEGAPASVWAQIPRGKSRLVAPRVVACRSAAEPGPAWWSG